MFWDSGCKVTPSKTGEVKNCRKVIQYYSHADTKDDEGGHGTHVCGSVMGRRSTAGGYVAKSTNSGGNNGKDVDGMARDAKLAFFDIGWFDPDAINAEGTKGADVLKIPSVTSVFDIGKLAGATFHSASWGTSSASLSATARGVDSYMHANDEWLVLVAAGNSGEGNEDPPNLSTWNVLGTIGAPATAKNILSVGATQGK